MRKPDFRALKTKVIDTKDDAAELARRAHDAVSERAEKAREEYSLRRNKPIFMEDIKREDYQLPNIIQVVDDDARKEKLSCESAIGFDEGIKEAAVFTFLTQFADDIGVSYYPSLKESIYYVDPVNPYHYIDMDEYFDYLRTARVNELVEVAQALGAVSVKVKMLEEKRTLTGKKQKESIKGQYGGVKASAEGKHEEERKEFSKVELLSENTFPGGNPKKPKLNYFRNQSEIQHLIKLRLNKEFPLKRKVQTFKASSSFGIKTTDAAKIDVALKKIGTAGATCTMTELANSENRTSFEYEIVFPD